MKVYMVATEEPMSSRIDTFDEYGNPLADSLSLYLHREDAEKAVKLYNEEILGETAWVVAVEVEESGSGY